MGSIRVSPSSSVLPASCAPHLAHLGPGLSEDGRREKFTVQPLMDTGAHLHSVIYTLNSPHSAQMRFCSRGGKGGPIGWGCSVLLPDISL